MFSATQCDIEKFPITEFLPEICNKLKKSSSRAIVLTAETGAGKSTILPLGLLEHFEGKILMTEPRRLAVLGVAGRVEDLLRGAKGVEETKGTDPSDFVGYRIHLESKITKATRLEVMTEAILVRMLQENPALEGYNVVVLDEAHERSVNFDLALAFLKEAMELRDDLYVIVMSATMDCKRLAKFLVAGSDDQSNGLEESSNGLVDQSKGSDEGSVPLVTIPGRTFPVTVTYDTKSTVEQAVLQELETTSEGNILVFLPGIAEIRRTENNLREIFASMGTDPSASSPQLHLLHSSITLEDQKKVMVPLTSSKQRRVILSSAIAETSLTVPGVTTVIDSGYSRVSRMNIATGMQQLVTERESEFSAEQRKGRAGRECAGRCIRLWSQHDVRVQSLEPEILRCDLASLVLECAERGITELQKIHWLDSPSAPEWQKSVQLLQQFNFLDQTKKITSKGRAALTLGLHPRLANIALEEAVKNGRGKPSPDSRALSRSSVTPSAGVPATPLSPCATKLLINYGGYEKSAPQIQKQFIADLERRLQKIDFSKLEAEHSCPNPYLILAGYPDRLAYRLSKPGDVKAEYQFPSGRKACLIEELKTTPQWLVAPEVLAGTSEAKIFQFEEIHESQIKEWLKTRVQTEITCEFVNGKIKKSENLCYGKIVLSSKVLPSSSNDYAQAWVTEVKNKGISCLPSDKKLEDFLDRAKFYFQQNQKVQNKLNLLQENVEEWLIPFVTGSNLSAQNVYDALFWYLDGGDIEGSVPSVMNLSNGKKVKVKYELLADPQNKNQLVIRPVVEVIIQRMFGCFETPKICGMKVLLRLLSPASRPLQITDDLENFWTSTWTEICKEMKGRYPKHNWDYKIIEKD